MNGDYINLLDQPWIHRKNCYSSFYRSVDQNMELGENSSIHVIGYNALKNRWIHRKKLVVKNRWIHRKKLAFQIFGGSVDQKTELGERKKTVTFFCVDPQRKPVTFVRGSTEKNLLLPDFQSVDPQKVK